jgi:hypothetical protein
MGVFGVSIELLIVSAVVLPIVDDLLQCHVLTFEYTRNRNSFLHAFGALHARRGPTVTATSHGRSTWPRQPIAAS